MQDGSGEPSYELIQDERAYLLFRRAIKIGMPGLPQSIEIRSVSSRVASLKPLAALIEAVIACPCTLLQVLFA